MGDRGPVRSGAIGLVPVGPWHRRGRRDNPRGGRRLPLSRACAGSPVRSGRRSGAVRRRGPAPAPMVVIRHLSGAHLGALAVLGAVGEQGDCPHPATRIDAALLLSGFYDPPHCRHSPATHGHDAGRRSGRVADRQHVPVGRQPSRVPVFLAHGAHDGSSPSASRHASRRRSNEPATRFASTSSLTPATTTSTRRRARSGHGRLDHHIGLRA